MRSLGWVRWVADAVAGTDAETLIGLLTPAESATGAEGTPQVGLAASEAAAGAEVVGSGRT